LTIIKTTLIFTLIIIIISACGGSSSNPATVTEAPVPVVNSTEPYPEPAQLDSPQAAYPSPLEQTFDHTGAYAATVKVSDGSERDVTLVVSPDGEATMTIQEPGEAAVVQTGEWQSDSRYLIIAFNQRDGVSYSENYTFELIGSQLVATIFDQQTWSQEGLVLSRSAIGVPYP